MATKRKTVTTPLIAFLRKLRALPKWNPELLDTVFPGRGEAIHKAYYETEATGRVYAAGLNDDGVEAQVSHAELVAMFDASQAPIVAPEPPPPGRPTDPVPPVIVPPPAPEPHPVDVLAEKLLYSRDRAGVDVEAGGTGLAPHELLLHFGALGYPPYWAARFTAALLLEAVRDPAAP